MRKLFGELESLKGEVPSGGQNEGSDSRLRDVLVEAVNHGDEKRCRFAGAGASHGNDVGARENEGHGLALNGSGDFVTFALDSPEHIRTQTE